MGIGYAVNIYGRHKTATGEPRKYAECKCGERFCKYYRGWRPDKDIDYCKAFKEGIPDEIAFGDDLHLTPRENQGNALCYSKGTDPSIMNSLPTDIIMRDRRQHGHDAICSTIRDIYLKTDDEDIKLWCLIAYQMGKNMHWALLGYRDKLLKAGFPVGEDSRVSWQTKGNVF